MAKKQEVVMIEAWGIHWGIEEFKDELVKMLFEFIKRDPELALEFIWHLINQSDDLDEIEGIVEQCIAIGKGWA